MPLVASMKTDVIFYELIKELPQIFFELIDKPDTNPNIYTFIAPEIKQQSFRLDGLFSQGKRISNPIDTNVLGFTQSTNKFKITTLSQRVGLTFSSLCG